MEYIKNNIQIILIVVVGILVATNIFTFTQVTALEKDLNAKVEDIDTEIALQSKSIQFVQTDLGYLEKHKHLETSEEFPRYRYMFDTEEISEVWCLTNPREYWDKKFPDPKPTHLLSESYLSYGNSGAMLIIRDIDDGVSWHTAKCE